MMKENEINAPVFDDPEKLKQFWKNQNVKSVEVITLDINNFVVDDAEVCYIVTKINNGSVTLRKLTMIKEIRFWSGDYSYKYIKWSDQIDQATKPKIRKFFTTKRMRLIQNLDPNNLYSALCCPHM